MDMMLVVHIPAMDEPLLSCLQYIHSHNTEEHPKGTVETVEFHKAVDIEYHIVDCIGYHIVDIDHIVDIAFHTHNHSS